MAQRDDKRRAAGLAIVGLLPAAGGTGGSLAARHGDQSTIERGAAAEATARDAGRPAPPGNPAEDPRKEADAIPCLLQPFTFAGMVLPRMAVAGVRGWRLLDPIAEQAPPPRLP